MENEVLEQIEQIIGYRFSNRDLLTKAFIHSSAVENRTLCNERMEFLGDSILALIICQNLFERFTEYLEGDLTKIKSMLVSRRTCASIIKQLDLHKFLKIGKGMTGSRSLTGSVAAGLYEAIVAAIYFDGGLEAAEQFILRTFNSLIEQADAKQTQGNFKSVLQQYSQQNFDTTPVYELLDEKGPDHNKCFEATVIVGKKYYPSAWGASKKDAEQKAAFNALFELGVLKKEDEVPA